MLTATEAAALLSISKNALRWPLKKDSVLSFPGLRFALIRKTWTPHKAQCRSPATTPDAGSISLTVSSTASESALQVTSSGLDARPGARIRPARNGAALRRGNWWRASGA